MAPKPNAQAFVKCYARVRRGEARDRRGGFGWGLLDWMGQVICYCLPEIFGAGLGDASGIVIVIGSVGTWCM